MSFKKIGSCLWRLLKRLPGMTADFLYANLWSLFFYMYLLAIVALFVWNQDASLSLSFESLVRGLRSAFLPALCLMLIRGFILCGHPGIFRRLSAGFVTSVISFLSGAEVWMSFMLHSRWSDRIIRLIADTNAGESGEFFERYLFTAKSVGILIGFLLISIVVHDLLKSAGHYLRLRKGKLRVTQRLGVVLLIALGCYWWSLPRENDYNTENSVNTLTRLDKMVKIYKRNLKMIKALERTPKLADGVIPDSVLPPARIVWVIGESDSKAHWSLYGYRMPTTPMMQKELENGNLIKFEDVICYEPRTYRMMEILFSPHVVSDSSKYYFKKPMTPMIMRKAGYAVRLHDNQATLVRGDDQAEVGTCNFMNSLVLSRANFNYRNERMYKYDMELLEAATPMLKKTSGVNVAGAKGKGVIPNGSQNKESKNVDNPTLDIFHLNGQHFSAVNRYPSGFGRFSVKDYSWRKDMNADEKRQIAEYDNATLYVDQWLSKLIETVKGQDAIIIYHPDHGEEMNDERHCHVRTLDSHKIPQAAPYVLEIPFIIYTTPEFRKLHPELYSKLQAAASEKQSLIYFSHLLLDIAGVESQYKRPEFSPLSPRWSSPPRLVKDIGNYDNRRQ